MLHEFVDRHRAEIIANVQARAAARSVPVASPAELERGVPVFLDQLVAALRAEHDAPPTRSSTRTIEETAAEYGELLRSLGLTVGQVVHGYGDVCQAVTELAVDHEAAIRNSEFRTLNRCLDDAIAGAVAEHARSREQSLAASSTERLGHLAHELRNALTTAVLSLSALQTGKVGIGGSTGAALSRSLRTLGGLIERSLAEVRLDSGSAYLQRVDVATFVEDLEIGASLGASDHGLVLNVPEVEPGLAVHVDAQLLSSALGNLLHNAFKFTHRDGKVTLTARRSGTRVLLEVEDQCGGMFGATIESLFRPFVRGAAQDQSGLGLGLSISRRAVESQHGTLTARNVPGTGCVFTIDLPAVA